MVITIVNTTINLNQGINSHQLSFIKINFIAIIITIAIMRHYPDFNNSINLDTKVILHIQVIIILTYFETLMDNYIAYFIKIG